MSKANLCLPILFLLLAFGCSAQNCDDIPAKFKSYEEAESIIQKAKFTYIDQISTSKSSWILCVKYYSCVGKASFFVLQTKNGKKYIFQGVPIDLWKGFKTAQSHGQFYNQHIRNRYQLKINQS